VEEVSVEASSRGMGGGGGRKGRERIGPRWEAEGGGEGREK